MAEVQRVLGDNVNPGLEQMTQLKYVETCAQETMRLKPVAPILPLQTCHEVMIGDVGVPEGVIVMNLMRRYSAIDKNIPNAAAFQP